MSCPSSRPLPCDSWANPRSQPLPLLPISSLTSLPLEEMLGEVLWLPVKGVMGFLMVEEAELHWQRRYFVVVSARCTTTAGSRDQQRRCGVVEALKRGIPQHLVAHAKHLISVYGALAVYMRCGGASDVRLWQRAKNSFGGQGHAWIYQLIAPMMKVRLI